MSREKMMTSEDFIKISDRIKKIKDLTSDTAVAELLDMNQSSFAERKRRGSIPYEEIIRFCDKEGISIDWLLTGKGEKEQKLEVYDLAPATMNIDGEQTYITNQGPMTFSDICSSIGISPHDFDLWLKSHHKNLRGKYRNIEKIIREENYTTESSLDPRLIVLHNQLEYLYKEGSIDDRARIRGLIEELYDEIIKRKELQKKEELIEQKKVG